MLKLLLMLLFVLALTARIALGDFATPWVEGTKVGDVVTAHGWVIALDPDKTMYGVVVRTDTMESVIIRAEAREGVVDMGVLGRWAKVKAKVTKRIDEKTVAIEILEVKPILPTAVKKTG